MKVRIKINLLKFAKLSLFVAIAFLLAQTSPAQKSDKLVESLDVQGNRRLKDSEIILHIKTFPGKKFSEKQIQEDLKNLLALGWFDKANTRVFTKKGRRGGVDVIFEVRELPIIEKVLFEGLENFTEEQIIADLQQKNLNIKEGDVFNINKVRKVKVEIEKFLKERGFFDAKVTWFEKQISATNLEIGFVIVERPES